jgi:hypothetical protein
MKVKVILEDKGKEPLLSLIITKIGLVGKM